jgi:hypothetical protein
MFRTVGKIIVPVPGTPVRATINEPDPTKRLAAHAVMVEALAGNTGKIYIGLTGMNKTTFNAAANSNAGVLAVLAVPTANTIPTFSATISYAPAPFNIADLFIDSDNANEGVLITAIVG